MRSAHPAVAQRLPRHAPQVASIARVQPAQRGFTIRPVASRGAVIRLQQPVHQAPRALIQRCRAIKLHHVEKDR
jgi:hypothetical protein